MRVTAAVRRWQSPAWMRVLAKLYKGTRYYNGEAAIVVKRWFHRTDDDPLGRTFVEWDPKGPDVAADAPPVEMLINSIKLRAVFGVEDFKQVLPPGVQTCAHTGDRGCGAAAGGCRQDSVHLAGVKG